MPKELPTPPPEFLAKVDQLYASCNEILDRYIAGFQIDVNRHTVKHGPMSPEMQHWHMTKILKDHVPVNMLAGIVAAAIVRGIAGKAKGHGGK